jgi:hypothetical protein
MPASNQANTNDRKLKIGLLVDSELVSKHLFDLAQWCQAQPVLCISHLLVMEASSSRRHRMAESLRRTCLSAVRWFETILLKRSGHKSSNACHVLDALIPETITVRMSTDASGCNIACSADGLDKIRGLKLDVLLMAGSGKLQGDILSAVAFGVISPLYSDENVIRGGPAGFWEVFFRHDYTGFAIRLQSKDAYDGNNIVSGRMRTQNYYSLNSLRIQQKCLYYLKSSLASIARDGQITSCDDATHHEGIHHGIPGLLSQVKYISSLGLRLFKRAVRSKLGIDFKWNVAYKKNDWATLSMPSAVKISNPKNHFLADPFVVSESGRDYCFLEDYDYSSQIGHIAVYELHDHKAEYLGKALVEPYHLSFPYMFRYKSELYMCPETSRNRQIRVYKCVSFPLQWQLHAVLMDDVSAADTMLFELGGRWWMLTNVDVTGTGDYYWADSPFSSQWTAHDANPVFIDAAKGRNAGLLFDATHIYRVSQKQSFDFYGEEFSINRIDQLDETAYRESEVRTVQADFFPNTFGTHHMHSNGGVTVFDFLQLNKI